MNRRLRLLTTALHQGHRLDHVVGAWLTDALGRPLSKSAVRRLIMAGAVRRDGAPLRRPAVPLAAGQRLEVVADLDRLFGRSRDVAFAMTDHRIIHEDDWLLAVDKPPGLPTHPTADPRRPSLVAALREFLGRRERRDRPVHLGVHQRLDRDTSGVVLFTKDPRADAGLAALFASRAIAKVYEAITARPESLPPASWVCRASLTTTPGGRVEVDRRGTPAETELRRLEVLLGGLRIEARPRTGRKHQVRVHLASAGMPILGDETYGSGSMHTAPRLMLHARSLGFVHPVSGVRVSIESPCPPDFVRVLEALGGDRGPASRRRR